MLAKNPEKPTQLHLEFPTLTAMGHDDFLLGESNETAFKLITAWPDWPDPLQLIVGPMGSGKSHLVEIWAEASNAYIARDRFLASEILRVMDEGQPVALEFGDLQTIDEPAVFHVLNKARLVRSHLLVTARGDWDSWKDRLADLVSRVRAMPPVVLGAPDEDLLKKVMVKLFADRQAQIDMPVLDYALLRLERSFEAANLFVTACDEIALRTGKKISKHIAADALYAVENRLPRS